MVTKMKEEDKYLCDVIWSLFFEIHYQNCHISKQIEKFNTFASLFGLSESEIKGKNNNDYLL